MKKKLLVLLMIAMCSSIVTTACTEDTSSTITKDAEDADEEDEDEDKEDKEDKKDKKDKESEEESEDEESEDKDSEDEDDDKDADEEKTEDEKSDKKDSDKKNADASDKNYDAERLADAYPINHVKISITSGTETATVTIVDSSMQITASSSGIDMDIYAVDNMLYTHMVGQGQDVWAKTASKQNEIDDMLEELGTTMVADSIKNVEYVKTVEENGTTYDVVKATEMRDGEDYQDLTFYINVETGLTERTESDSMGQNVVIYYEPCDEVVLPKEALNAQEF